MKGSSNHSTRSGNMVLGSLRSRVLISSAFLSRCSTFIFQSHNGQIREWQGQTAQHGATFVTT